MTDEVEKGKRFALQYARREKPISVITPEARNRLLTLYRKVVDIREGEDSLLDYLKANIGISYYESRLADVFLESSDIVFLNMLTEIYKYIDWQNDDSRTKIWRSCIETVFEEEQLAYRIDDQGGIHPHVDAEFEMQRISTIEALSAKRYSATRVKFESAHAALKEKDNKTAIWHCFEAVENLFRLIAEGKGPALSGVVVKEKLLPIIASQNPEDASMQRAANQIVKSLAEWIDGAHNFRHAQGEEVTTIPPVEITVTYLGLSAGFLHWLTDLDQKLQTNKKSGGWNEKGEL